MYKFDECQSLNSDTSEYIQNKLYTGRGIVNVIGAQLISFHTGLLKRPLYMKHKSICATFIKNGHF